MRERAYLAIVLGVAAILRFWSLGHGIPFAIGVDEPEIMARVLTMMRSGDFNPHFFHYGGFIFYLHLPVAVARFLAGALAGRWGSLDAVSAADFYLWGRALTAAMGTATVFVLYRVGIRWGARHALLGAGLLAVMPSHVRESHYALTDVPVTFLVTLTLLLSIVAQEKATWRAFAWAGLSAGLVIATKYNAGIALLLPLVAAWTVPPAGTARMVCLLAVIGGTGAGVLIGAPFTVLDLPGFLEGFAHLASYYRPRPSGAEAGWLVYLKHLRLNMQWPALVLMLAGLVFAAVRAMRGPAHVRWVLLLLFPLGYFGAIANRSLIYGRYLLPLLPALCLIAGVALVSGVTLLRRVRVPLLPRQLLITAGTVATVLPPLVASIGFVRSISGDSTPAAAYRWIDAHIPDGSHIVIEKFDLRLDGPDYRAEHVVRLTDRDWESYACAGVQYLVASSQVFGPVLDRPEAAPDTYARYRALFDRSKELVVVKPSPGRPGPELRIYQLR